MISPHCVFSLTTLKIFKIFNNFLSLPRQDFKDDCIFQESSTTLKFILLNLLYGYFSWATAKFQIFLGTFPGPPPRIFKDIYVYV